MVRRLGETTTWLGSLGGPENTGDWLVGGAWLDTMEVVDPAGPVWTLQELPCPHSVDALKGGTEGSSWAKRAGELGDGRGASVGREDRLTEGSLGEEGGGLAGVGRGRWRRGRLAGLDGRRWILPDGRQACGEKDDVCKAWAKERGSAVAVGGAGEGAGGGGVHGEVVGQRGGRQSMLTSYREVPRCRAPRQRRHRGRYRRIVFHPAWPACGGAGRGPPQSSSSLCRQ